MTVAEDPRPVRAVGQHGVWEQRSFPHVTHGGRHAIEDVVAVDQPVLELDDTDATGARRVDQALLVVMTQDAKSPWTGRAQHRNPCAVPIQQPSQGVLERHLLRLAQPSGCGDATMDVKEIPFQRDHLRAGEAAPGIRDLVITPPTERSPVAGHDDPLRGRDRRGEPMKVGGDDVAIDGRRPPVVDGEHHAPIAHVARHGGVWPAECRQHPPRPIGGRAPDELGVVGELESLGDELHRLQRTLGHVEIRTAIEHGQVGETTIEVFFDL